MHGVSIISSQLYPLYSVIGSVASSKMSVLCAVTLLLGLDFSLFMGSKGDGKQDAAAYEISCLSKKYNFSNVTNTTIVFADCGNGVFNLTSPLNIFMGSDLHITGDKMSVIECGSDTGIILKGISKLYLKNLQINNCYNPEFNGSIHIKNCKDVTFENITIESSSGAGLVLENNRGEVVVESSTFHNNGLSEYIQESRVDNTYGNLQQKNGGGGLRVLVGSGVSHSLILVQNCQFSNNSAFSGGGVFVIVQPRAINNTVIICNSHFADNKCLNGGGGLQIGIIAADDKSDSKVVDPKDNTIIVQNCKFLSNIASYGGGAAVFTTSGSYTFSENKLEFSNCSWENNKANFGMAVDIATAPWETYTRAGLFPSPLFTDCTFFSHQLDTGFRRPASVLSVLGYRIKFGGKTSFRENNATAIEATSAELNFTANSNVEFFRNQGVFGGAMKLNGLTVIYVRDGSEFTFKENKADIGGAIYVDSYKNSVVPSESCFIQYKSLGDEHQSPNNVSIVFTDNTAGYTDTNNCTHNNNGSTDKNYCNYRGDSVYATTIVPCLGKCLRSLSSRSFLNGTEALTCIGSISFDKQNKQQISTGAHHFKHSDINYKDDQMCRLFLTYTNDDFQIHLNKNYSREKINPIQEHLHFIPGKKKILPLKLIDDLCGEIFFHVSIRVVKSERGSIFVDPAYSVVTLNSLVLGGESHDSGTVQLSTMDIRNEAILINVKMSECPPGFILDNKKCTCSTASQKYRYTGIERCNITLFQAYVKHGYWVDYIHSKNIPNRPSSSLSSAICPEGFCSNLTHWLWKGLKLTSGSKLAKALCPIGFCDFNSTNPLSEHLLPSDSTEDLSHYICHHNRHGPICSFCRANHSTFYRSMLFLCKPDDLCYLGWLFYILTELLPVTILFLVVIFFNISFTSGPLNGVIFFMQAVDAMKLSGENFIRINPTLLVSLFVQKLVYRVFILSVFAIEEFSFCLWKNASALDMLAFRYVTIIYSLFLVVATVFLMKMCTCRKRKLVGNLKRSIIHGLSAFVIMSYSECTRVSLMILTRGTVTVGPESNEDYQFKAFYYGNFSYMRSEHLRYALPAIFFILTMVSIPPLLLLGYPLCYKLFALLRIEESKCVEITCKIFPLEKIKPFFDSIQGAFKDRYRFFAGLYLVYRLCTLLTFTYTSTLTAYYTITGIQLVSMLLLHSVCRPYKKTWHNILDALLFTNLSVINAMTFYNYQTTSKYYHSETVNKVGGVQAALVLLPLVYLIIYTAYHIVKRIKVACVRKSITHKESDNTNEVIETLDARSLENSLVEMSDYLLLGPKP